MNPLHVCALVYSAQILYNSMLYQPHLAELEHMSSCFIWKTPKLHTIGSVMGLSSWRKAILVLAI